MGIDYSAESGIGYEVFELEDTYNEDEYENFGEFLDCNLTRDFSWFETGSAYSGDTKGYYIKVNEPFKYGLDLTKVKEELDYEIDRLKLHKEYFGVVGGLYIY